MLQSSSDSDSLCSLLQLGGAHLQHLSATDLQQRYNQYRYAENLRKTSCPTWRVLRSWSEGSTEILVLSMYKTCNAAENIRGGSNSKSDVLITMLLESRKRTHFARGKMSERVYTAWDAIVACSLTAMSSVARWANDNKQYMTNKMNRVRKMHSTRFDPIIGYFQPNGFKCAISPMCSGSLGCRQPLSSRLRSVATSLETRLKKTQRDQSNLHNRKKSPKIATHKHRAWKSKRLEVLHKCIFQWICLHTDLRNWHRFWKPEKWSKDWKHISYRVLSTCRETDVGKEKEPRLWPRYLYFVVAKFLKVCGSGQKLQLARRHRKLQCKSFTNFLQAQTGNWTSIKMYTKNMICRNNMCIICV